MHFAPFHLELMCKLNVFSSTHVHVHYNRLFCVVSEFLVKIFLQIIIANI